MRSLSGILILGALLAACGGSPGVASNAPPVASPDAVASDDVPSAAGSGPVLTPVPSAAASPGPAGSNGPAPDLRAGLRADLGDACEADPVDASTGGDARITCRLEGEGVESVTVTRFPSVDALLEAYLALVDANGIPRRSHGGRCEAGAASEGAYTPGDDGPTLAPDREACFVEGSGKARYLATISPRVLVEVTGTGADPMAIREWAWLGNQDAPGSPTIWRAIE